MSDLISRQAAIDALYSVDEYNSRNVKAIKQLPTIQPDIVRCKDCYNWDMSWDTDMPNCHFCYIVGKVRNAEDFCSYVERREVTT